MVMGGIVVVGYLAARLIPEKVLTSSLIHR
jgi:hypothetical protein